MHYVYSTMTTSVDYVNYRKGGADLNIKDKFVTINGGANLANKHLETPLGIVTEVNDEQLQLLLAHPVFKLHMEKGFIKHEPRKKDVEKAITDLNPKDRSAPKIDADFERSQGPKIAKNNK